MLTINKGRTARKESKMQVVMIRKAWSKNEWYKAFEGIRALFGREPQKVEAVIDKEIVLTNDELAAFENDLLADSEIVKENRAIMNVDKDQVWHCIAVTSKDAQYRILVESEGSDYARYTAIVQK